jgi:Zn-dependent protease
VSSYLKYGILEDIDSVKRIPIGRFWNITLLITPITWLSPFVFFALHFILNLVNYRLGFAERLVQALSFTIAVEVATAIHTFGHILSGKLIRSSMDELLITATRDVNLYHGDQNLVPGYVHLVRSLGGPILNILAAGVFYTFASAPNHSFLNGLIASLISTNLFIGLGSFLPLPSVDGSVIWREILSSLRARF